MNEQTYRKLLELAAKAAGIEGNYEPKYFCGAGPNDHGIYVEETGWLWNPIDDSGDAMRLAVKLRIEIMYNDDECVCQFWIDGKGFMQVAEKINSDVCATVRLAIVRAAAEIGKKQT